MLAILDQYRDEKSIVYIIIADRSNALSGFVAANSDKPTLTRSLSHYTRTCFAGVTISSHPLQCRVLKGVRRATGDSTGTAAGCHPPRSRGCPRIGAVARESRFEANTCCI